MGKKVERPNKLPPIKLNTTPNNPGVAALSSFNEDMVEEDDNQLGDIRF